MRRRNQLTGAVAATKKGKAINKLDVHPVRIPPGKQHHDTSGVPRSVRRGNRR